MYSEITTKELEQLIHSRVDIELIDVREKKEWDTIRIPSAKLMPTSSLEFRISEIDFSKPVYIFCRSGGRSAQVCAWLEGQGKKASNVSGGIQELSEGGSDVVEKRG